MFIFENAEGEVVAVQTVDRASICRWDEAGKVWQLHVTSNGVTETLQFDGVTAAREAFDKGMQGGRSAEFCAALNPSRTHALKID